MLFLTKITMVQLNINVGGVYQAEMAFKDSTRHRAECLKDVSESHKVRVRVI